MYKLGELISTVLNPIILLIPVPYILVLRSTKSVSEAFSWEIFTLIFILVFTIFILVGIEKKVFSDFDISVRSQRPLLLTFSVALCAIYTVLLYFLKAPPILFVAIFALILGLISIEIINRVTKVSIHVAMVSAFSTSLALVYGGVYLVALLLIPIVGWARIVTKNHTRQQVRLGAMLGALITFVVYVIFKYII